MARVIDHHGQPSDVCHGEGTQPKAKITPKNQVDEAEETHSDYSPHAHIRHKKDECFNQKTVAVPDEAIFNIGVRQTHKVFTVLS